MGVRDIYSPYLSCIMFFLPWWREFSLVGMDPVGRKRKQAWQVTPLCLLWMMWWERNRKAFDNEGILFIRLNWISCVIFGVVLCFLISRSLFIYRFCGLDLYKLRGYHCIWVWVTVQFFDVFFRSLCTFMYALGCNSFGTCFNYIYL